MLDTIFLIAAVVGGTVMVCQFVMMFLGMGDDGSGDIGADADLSMDVDGLDGGMDGGIDGVDGLDADHQTTWTHAADADLGHPDASRIFEILSFRSVVAAMAFFGLGGAWASSSGYSPTKSLAIAVVAGGIALYAVFKLMQALYSLRSSGNVSIENAIGLPATIYIPVPKEGCGKGKIQLTLQGRTMEYEAMTDEEEILPTGDHVVVVDVLSNDLVLVSRQLETEEPSYT